MTCSDRCADWDQRLETITEYGYAGSDPQSIKNTLVTYGPLSASMEWEGSGSFTDGVYHCKTENQTNHAVVIVGYDDHHTYQAGEDIYSGVWIVRNSWGTGFGEGGYFFFFFQT